MQMYRQLEAYLIALAACHMKILNTLYMCLIYCRCGGCLLIASEMCAYSHL